MEFTQSKLTKSEWVSIETPVSDNEINILNLILNGYDNISICVNKNKSLLQILNIEFNPEIERYLFKEYFETEIVIIKEQLLKLITQSNNTKSNKKKHNQSTNVAVINNAILNEFIQLIDTFRMSLNTHSIKPPSKIDIIRIKNTTSKIDIQKPNIFEYLLLELCFKITMSLSTDTLEYGFLIYTLIQLQKSTIFNINQYVNTFTNNIIILASTYTNITNVFRKSYDFIEKNPYLFKYEDITLYSHQKQLFSTFKNQPNPKLVLYMAPTGTGKTLSPIGLSQQYKVIFVCVARHVGLALAKSAISVGKKVAFAFGCDTASDIRLHYFSAQSYTKNKKSGGIGKVDNSIGNKVEIMICDVKSYITAMHYMLAFNSEPEIITYWDEPTITMDYENHELHETIHNNWVNNKISKLVLSCATLPKEHEIINTMTDFKNKFVITTDDDLIIPEIITITSFDCKKSISLLGQTGKCMVPHLMFNTHAELLETVSYCENNKTLLRYIDLPEIIRFVDYVCSNNCVPNEYKVSCYFTSISDITMNNIKEYYLTLLKHTYSEKWNNTFIYLTSTQTTKFYNNNNNNQSNPFSGILLTTKDAHTLTDGPTIYLTEDINKIGNFMIQQSNIPEKIFQDIINKIEINNSFQKKIDVLNHNMEDGIGNENEKEKKMERLQYSKVVLNIMEEIKNLQKSIKCIKLDSTIIPNTVQHQQKWNPDQPQIKNAFIPDIEEVVVKDIMGVDVNNQMKLLLLLGIGMFVNEPNIIYMEIMKKLAQEQKLYIIIADSDYIYGTNYQFCHGFIGKGLTNMTQQKTIQSMGRIGRNNIQQEYTVRFRDDTIIQKLFKPTNDNIEAKNMSRLFCE